MGTTVRVEVRALDRETGLRASERILSVLREAESRLSTWREDSELAALNRAPIGVPIDISRRLHADLERAWACARSTGNAFDPAIGPLVAAWGLRTGGRVPAAAALVSARNLSAPEVFRLESDGTAIRMREGASIEEGGFGKGAALDDALTPAADEPGTAGVLLDLGGQVGVRTRGEPWSIELAHPRDRLRPIASLRLANGSIATSGNSEHGIEIEGTRYAHLLDPRNGAPAVDFGSLVVLAPDGLDADCLSTGLYVLGPDAALRWALEHPGIDVAVLEPRGRGVWIRATPGLADRIRVVEPDVTLTRIDELQPLPPDTRGASNQTAIGRAPGRGH